MNINEGMHRLVLRVRWMKWLERRAARFNAERRNMSERRIRKLSRRLTRWAPVWHELPSGGWDASL